MSTTGIKHELYEAEKRLLNDLRALRRTQRGDDSGAAETTSFGQRIADCGHLPVEYRADLAIAESEVTGFGVAVHGRSHPGMIHYFYCMPRMIPYAAEAMRIIGTEIRYAVALPQKERRAQRRIRPELIRA